jgi:hypothetical protein
VADGGGGSPAARVSNGQGSSFPAGGRAGVPFHHPLTHSLNTWQSKSALTTHLKKKKRLDEMRMPHRGGLRKKPSSMVVLRHIFGASAKCRSARASFDQGQPDVREHSTRRTEAARSPTYAHGLIKGRGRVRARALAPLDQRTWPDPAGPVPARPRAPT